MKIIKSLKDIEKANLKFGDEYIIDVFPDVSEENQEITLEMLIKRDEIQVAIEAMFKPKEEDDDCCGTCKKSPEDVCPHKEFTSLKDLLKLKEVDIIALGERLEVKGLDKKDLKKNNAAKVWEKLNAK